MLGHERKTHLLSLLTQSGSIIAKDVSRDLGVSEDTIRRDLRELARDGRLKRVHGGAVPLSPANAPFPRRIAIATPEKAAIGKRAALLIEPGHVVFIDGGTTALQLVRHLPKDLRATVITHSPNIAMELLYHDLLEIEIVGGRLYRHSIVTCGAATLESLDKYRPDLCILGATGVHPDQGITTGDSEEAAVKRAIMSKSGATILLASSEKLGAIAAFKISDWSSIDGLVVSQAGHAKARLITAQIGCDLYVSDAD